MNRVRLLKILLVVVPLVVVVLVLRGVGESCRQRGLPKGYGKVAETDRWRVYGPLDEPAVLRAGEELDRFRNAFHRTYAEAFALSRSSDKLSVYLFRDRAPFEAWSTDRLTDSTDRIVGYYQPARWVIAAIAPDGLGLETLRHEAVHAILDRDVRGTDHAWSPWLNEGLAQAFEEARDAGGGRLEPGPMRPEQRDLVLAEHEVGRLPVTWKFAELDHEAFMANAQIHYAYAAALVQYLLRERWEAFRVYFEDERKRGRIHRGVFPQRFGPDLRPGLVAWLRRAE